MRDQTYHSAWIDGSGAVGCEGDPSGLFPWWSFTKTVLAVAALVLVEQGRLDLDSGFRGRPFSLRQLLTHRAGVANYGRLARYHDAVARGEDAWSREVLLEAVHADQLEFPPGTRWSYSNVGYLYVREAIEEATGLTLDRALDTLVLAPLGLHRTRIAMTREDFRSLHWAALHDYDPGWVYHGCLIGPATEAAALLHGIFSGAVLAPAPLSAMYDRRTPLGASAEGRLGFRSAYGMGLMIFDVTEYGRAMGHSGGGPHGVNAVYHFPDLPRPRTIAVFAEGQDEAIAEQRVRAILKGLPTDQSDA